jgi:hypothetical protein
MPSEKTGTVREQHERHGNAQQHDEMTVAIHFRCSLSVFVCWMSFSAVT